MKIVPSLKISSIIFFLMACSTTVQKPAPDHKSGVTTVIDEYVKNEDNAVALSSIEKEQESTPVGDSLESDTRNNLEVRNDQLSVQTPIAEDAEDLPAIKKIDKTNNEQVEEWIQYFSQKDRERFVRMLERGANYKSVVENILAENGLPKELFYLALIESGFVTHAKSSAKAVGVWQFMKATGKRYGLSVNNYIDERKDPIRATEAAAKYLRELYEVFQSWELSLAAYNCGEYRVLGAVMRGGTRDFWKLYEKGLLPKETRNYVPKFRAAMLIGESLEKYGIDLKVSEVNYPDLDSVEVPSPVKLADIATRSGVSVDELKKYNPNILQGITPPQFDKYEVWIPSDNSARLSANISNLPRTKARVVGPVENFSDRHYYVVRGGDNLSLIAKKTGLSVSHLKAINNLSRSKLFVGQKIRVSSKRYHVAKSEKSGARSNQRSRSVASQKVKIHKVRRGETLNAIARKFNISVNALKKYNKFAQSKVLVGQRVKIPL